MILEYSAAVLSIIGIIVLSYRHKSGFIINILASLMWIGVSLDKKMVGLLITNLVIALVNLNGYIVWSKKNSDREKIKRCIKRIKKELKELKELNKDNDK